MYKSSERRFAAHDDEPETARHACCNPGDQEDLMGSYRLLAIVLIVVGVLGLAYGGFSYTRESHDAKLGPIELSVKEKETVNIPMWSVK